MPDRIVVTNSTPVIALSSIYRLELLKDLYGEIIIPKAVHDEVMAKKDSVSQLALVQANDWIITKIVINSEAKKFFKVQLHEGEVEVMLLGKELKANLLIIDDYLAREYAKYLDFEITGTLGVILKAKEKRIIGEIKPLLSDLIDNGIYIGNKLFQDVLKLAEE
jgi:predicted nucleic acid-binding protein